MGNSILLTTHVDEKSKTACCSWWCFWLRLKPYLSQFMTKAVGRPIMNNCVGMCVCTSNTQCLICVVCVWPISWYYNSKMKVVCSLVQQLNCRGIITYNWQRKQSSIMFPISPITKTTPKHHQHTTNTNSDTSTNTDTNTNTNTNYHYHLSVWAWMHHVKIIRPI